MKGWQKDLRSPNSSDGQQTSGTSDFMRQHYTNLEKKPLRDETPTDIESAELQQIRRSFGTVLQHLGFPESFSHKEILERDWDSSFASSFAIGVRKGFMSDIHEHLEYVYNTFLDKNPSGITDVSMQDKAIKDFSDSLEELLRQRNNAAQQQPELLASLRQTWERVSRSDELPGRKKLQNFPANAIWRLFALGLVGQDQKDNLKNRVYEEPSYSINTLKTAQFVLEGLGKEMLSAEYIESIARQCMADTSIWENVSYLIPYDNKPPDWRLALTNSRRDNNQWGYMHGVEIGFPLKDGSNYSEEGYEELCAKYDCRTNGPKRDNRYPNGHPVGDLCHKDPRIMVKQEDGYYIRALGVGEAQMSAKIIIDKYHEEIKASHGDDDKTLDAIVHCCQDLFQAHLLRDGNTRIIAGFILPKLLLENGLRPAIITEKEAKLFAIFSFAEAKQFVIEGQAAFDKLITVIRRSDMDNPQPRDTSPKTDGQRIDITRQNYRRSERHRDQQATFLHNQIKEDRKEIDTTMREIRDFRKSLSVLPISDQLIYKPLIANLEKKYTDLMLYEYPTLSQDDGSIPKMVRDVTEGYRRRGPEYPGYIGNPFSKLTSGHKARSKAELKLYKASVEIEKLRTELEAFRLERQRKLNDKRELFHNKIKEDKEVINTIMRQIRNLETVLSASEQPEKYRALIITKYQSKYANLTSKYTSVFRPGEPGSTPQTVLAVTEEPRNPRSIDLPENLDIAFHEIRELRTELEDIDPLVNSCIELGRKSQIKQILEKAKPELSNTAKQAYQALANLNRQAESYSWNMADEQARSSFETNFFPAYYSLLEELSPELMQMFKTRDIKFVIRAPKQGLDPFRIAAKKNAEGECEVRLVIPSEYGVSGMVLRSFDALMEGCLRQDEYVSPEVRAVITCEIYLVNKIFGPMGFACERGGYEKYCENFNAGITETFEQGLIDTNTPKEELIYRGHNYAVKNLLDFIASMKRDDREMFLNMKPGGSLQDNCSWKPNQGQQAVEVGSNEFDALEQEAMERRDKGENFIFNVSVTLEDKLMGQLFYPERSERIKSHHEENLDGGNPCWWSGEVDIVIESDNQTGKTIKKVTRVKDRTGHYRTYNPLYPNRAIRYALELFEQHGYDTSDALIEIKAWVPEKIHPYEGYDPPTLANPQHDVLNDDEFREVNKWLRGQIPTENVKDLLVQLGAYRKLPT